MDVLVAGRKLIPDYKKPQHSSGSPIPEGPLVLLV